MSRDPSEPYAYPRYDIAKGVFTHVKPEAQPGFEAASGSLVLERTNLTELAVMMRNHGFSDLMLVSNGKDLQFVMAKPSQSNTGDHALYLRQRLNTEHDPQNGKFVLIALDLTRSIDEQYVETHAFEVKDVLDNGKDLPYDYVSMCELSRCPIIAPAFRALSGEPIPDAPQDSVERQTLFELLNRDQKALGRVVMSRLPSGRMLSPAFPPV